MRRRYSRVLDTSAIVALYNAHPTLLRLLNAAEAGTVDLYLPAVCVAAAGQTAGISESAWAPLQYTGGVRIMPLQESAAVEMSGWPGTVDARHAVWEARRLRGAVVTCEPGRYEGLRVDLSVVAPDR